MDTFCITIQEHYLCFLLNLKIDEVLLGYLYSQPFGTNYGFISELEMEDIMCLERPTMKAYILMQCLGKRGSRALQVFIEALVFTDQMKLAEKLDSEKAQAFLKNRENCYPPF